MKISMPRGDIKWQRFMVKTPNGTASDIDFTNIYFTVKEDVTERKFFFQKSLQRGEIIRIGPGDYEFKIVPADTNRMYFDSYKFDIQIQYKDLIKETFVGDFIITDEVTYAENEDYPEQPSDYDLPHSSDAPVIIAEIPDYHIIQLETPINMATKTHYTDLLDLPTINGVDILGGFTSEDFDIQSVTTNGHEIVIKVSPRLGNRLVRITDENEEGLFVAPLHTLRLGPFEYNGTQDVTVPIYGGEII